MSHPANPDFENTKLCLSGMLAQLECVKCFELPKEKIWMPSTCNHKYCQTCIHELKDNKCQICQNLSNPKDRVFDLFSSNLLSELLLFEKQLKLEKLSSSSSSALLLKNQNVENQETISVQPQPPSFVLPEIPQKVTPQRPKTRYKSYASTPPMIAKFFEDEDDEDEEEESDKDVMSPPTLTQYDPEKQQQQQGSTTPTSTKHVLANTSSSSSNGGAPILSPQGLLKSGQEKISKKEAENNVEEIITQENSRPRRSSSLRAQKNKDTIITTTTSNTTTIKTKQNEKEVTKSVKTTTTTTIEQPSTSANNELNNGTLNNLDQQQVEEMEEDDTTSNDESNSKDVKDKKNNREKSKTMDKTVGKITRIFKFPREPKNKTVNLKPDGDVTEKPKKNQTNFSFFNTSTKKNKSIANSTTTTASTPKVELSNEEIIAKKPIVPITKLTVKEIAAKMKKSNKKNKKDDGNSSSEQVGKASKDVQMLSQSEESEVESDISKGPICKKRGQKKFAIKNDKKDDIISTTKKDMPSSSSSPSIATTKNLISNVTKIKQETIEKNSPVQIPITRRSRKTSTSSSICDSPASLNSPKLDKRNAKGETKLFIASRLGQLEKAQQLIDGGCDVDATDFAGWTPLHEAITGKAGLEIVKILCKAGCNVNALGMNNETPLHSACRLNAVQIVEHLLSCSASSAIRNIDGKLPRDLTTSEAVIKLLDEYELKIAEKPCSFQEEMPVELKVSFEKAIFYFAFEPSNDLREKCKQLRMKVSNELRSEVTHVIFDAKAKEKVELSLDYLFSLLTGTWMLSVQWLEDSLKHGKFLNPSKYTLGGCQISDITTIDSSSENSAVEKARINREHGNPGLFHGMNFYIYKNTSWSIKNAGGSKSSAILTLNKKDITRLIQAGGGNAINREPNPDVVDPCEFPERFHAKRSDKKDHELNFTSYVILYNENNMPPKVHEFEHFKSLKIDWFIHSCICFQLIEPARKYS